jgi:hypothetical protein
MQYLRSSGCALCYVVGKAAVKEVPGTLRRRCQLSTPWCKEERFLGADRGKSLRQYEPGIVARPELHWAYASTYNF